LTKKLSEKFIYIYEVYPVLYTFVFKTKNLLLRPDHLIIRPVFSPESQTLSKGPPYSILLGLTTKNTHMGP